MEYQFIICEKFSNITLTTLDGKVIYSEDSTLNNLMFVDVLTICNRNRYSIECIKGELNADYLEIKGPYSVMVRDAGELGYRPGSCACQ